MSRHCEGVEPSLIMHCLQSSASHGFGPGGQRLVHTAMLGLAALSSSVPTTIDVNPGRTTQKCEGRRKVLYRQGFAIRVKAGRREHQLNTQMAIIGRQRFLQKEMFRFHGREYLVYIQLSPTAPLPTGYI
mmetsp:Transcript_32101/g.85652  ORF Transcript_32101/g.85652 Transcript_32101/m.85652 type:complete len:130 (-) Transcript_32101:441-830(-)